MAEVGDVGTYEELVASGIPEGAVVQYVPSLAAVCLNKEQRLGRELTADEFARLSGIAPALVVLKDAATAVSERRGYEDIVNFEDYIAMSRTED